MDPTFTELCSKLSPDGKLIVSAMSKQIKKMEENFVSILTSKNDQIETLQTEVNDLKIKVCKMEDNLDEADAYQRKDTIIFSGNSIPVVTVGENCPNLVKNLLRDKLRIELDVRSVSTAHRLGKKLPTQAPDKRPIIAKLCQRDTKNLIMSASRNARLSDLYVNKSLTPARGTILYALRRIKRAHPSLVTGCSSFDGKIYVYTKPSSNAPPEARNVRHLINTRERLVLFCRDFIKKPLEDFLESWSH